MAIFGWGEDDEEYNPALGSGNTSGALGPGNTSGALGSYKKNDPLATSFDNFKIQFGGALQTVDELLGKDSFLSSWGNSLEESGELGKEDYQPKYETSFLEAEGWDKVGWAIEKASENAIGMGATVGASIVAAMAKKNPYVLAGLGASWAFRALLNLDEQARTHVDNSGKDVRDFSGEEKVNLVFGTTLATLLDGIAPNKVARGVTGKNVNVRDSLEALASKLDNFEKVKFANAVMMALKKTTAIGLWEGGTEGLQNLIAEFTSATRGRDLSIDETAGEMAAGFVGGKVVSTPAGIKAARADTIEAKQAQNTLDAFNAENLQEAQKDYTIKVQDYEKQYQDLVDKYEGPELDIKLKELGPISKIEDVVPERIDFTRLKTSPISKLTTIAGDALLNRSTDFLERTRANVKTGKDAFHLNRALRGFSDVESGTGQEQSNPSFNTLKHNYVGELLVPFGDIRDKWTNAYPLVGQFGGKIGQNIDKYLGQSLENKIDPKLRSEVKKQLGKKFGELEADIAKVKKIQNKVYNSLAKALGKDGLTINFQKDYLTRGIDRKAVKADPKGFLKSLENDVKIGPTKDPNTKQIIETAAQVRERILNDILNDIDPSILTSEQIRKLNTRKGTGRPTFEKSRDGRWNNLNEKFRKKSPFESVGDYLLNASTRLASADAFGANSANRLNDDINHLLKSETISNVEAEKMWDMYDALHHVYKRPQDDTGRTRQLAYKTIATAAAVKYLGMATISSITEPAWIVQRNGIINTMRAAPLMAANVLKGIKRGVWQGGVGKAPTSSFGRDLIRLMGFAVDPAMNERVEKLFAGDRNEFIGVYFRTPAGLFLTQYTNFVRTWAAVAGLKRIESEARKLKNMKPGRKQRLAEELLENGMTIEDFQALYAAGGNKIDILNDEWLNTVIEKSDGTQARIRDLMVPWVRKLVTDVALEPTATNRPLWMSNPDMQLLAQLKSFPILFGNTIAKRAIRKMNPKTCSPDFMGQMSTLAATGAALALGAMAMAIKDEIRGSERDHGPIDLVSAIGVPLIGETSLSGYVGGPAVSIVDDFLKSIYGNGLAETLAETPEQFFDIILRATVGSLGAELVEDD